MSQLRSGAPARPHQQSLRHDDATIPCLFSGQFDHYGVWRGRGKAADCVRSSPADAGPVEVEIGLGRRVRSGETVRGGPQCGDEPPPPPDENAPDEPTADRTKVQESVE